MSFELFVSTFWNWLHSYLIYRSCAKKKKHSHNNKKCINITIMLLYLQQNNDGYIIMIHNITRNSKTQALYCSSILHNGDQWFLDLCVYIQACNMISICIETNGPVLPRLGSLFVIFFAKFNQLSVFLFYGESFGTSNVIIKWFFKIIFKVKAVRLINHSCKL